MRKMIDIDFGSSRYDELVELRYKILLEPLGLKFLDHHRAKEANYLHIGCIECLDDKLVGGLILAPVNDEEIRLMQVAVDKKTVSPSPKWSKSFNLRPPQRRSYFFVYLPSIFDLHLTIICYDTSCESFERQDKNG